MSAINTGYQYSAEYKNAYRKKKLKHGSYLAVIYTLMIFLGILMIFPFIWTLNESLTPVGEKMIFAGGIDAGLENYKLAFQSLDFMRAFFNTLIIAVPKLFGDVVISALIAYGFARFEFKGKTVLFLILLATLIIPFEVTMIPLYIAYSKIGWIDTYYPLIVPALFGASQFIFFLTMYFITMPRDLISAAKIDGLSGLGIFRKIYLPISVPALIVVAIWSFQGTWNDLLGPLIWLQSSEKFTLQLQLTTLTTTTTGVPVPQSVILAATILVMIPVFILFITLQRYILDSTKTSGIKG